MSPRLCFALVAAVCCAVLAVATPAQEVPFDSLGFSVEFVKAVYHHRTDSTEFIYTVTSGSNTLSHWVLSPGCELDLYHPDDQDWLPYAVDQTTGATGYEALGQDAGTVHTVSIVFEGAVGVTPSATNDFTVKSGLKYAKGSVRGPLCNGGSIKTAGLCDQINDTTVSCPYVAVAGDYGQSSYTIDAAAGRCPNEKQYTISYLFNQADGVCEECVQVITVEDKTAPKISGIPKGQEYIQLSCNDPEPELPTGVVAHDDCQDGDITPNYCNKRNNGSCPNNYFLLRSWTATDECGNSECVTQTIAYLDETAPEFHGLPNNEVVECNISAGPIELTDNVTVSDHGCDCFVNPSKPVSYSSTTYPGECPNTYETIRTWTATDCCQNVAKATRKFIVKDTTAPELKLKNESLSANATFQCNAVPAAYEVVAADNCMGQAPVVTYTDKNHTGSCIGSYTIERLYTACDDCGNTGHLPSWWVIDDSIPPFWTSKPQNASNECGSHGKVTAPEASDSCSPIKNNTITYNDTIPGDCPNEFTIVHVWTAYDDCGNSVTHSYQEAVYDTTPVKIDPKSIPDLGPYNCAEDVPSLESILANIKPLACEGAHCACEQTFDRSATEVNTTDGCTNRVTIVRTYTFTDKCGNNDTVTKTIYVNDKNGPNLYGDAPDGEILCNQQAEVPTITKCDDCDACDCSEPACRTPVEREEKNETTSCPYIWTIKRNWTAVDECGNPSTKLQTITVVNPDVPRFIDPPPNKEVQCGDVPVKPNLTAVMNCTSVTVDNSIPDETEGSVCDGSYKIIRKWKATDDSCGKVTWYTQNITVIDTVDPVITGVPDDADYPCNEVPAPPAVCASDNCVGLSLKYSEVRNNYSTCGQPDQFVYELIRTWNATDKCGNQVIKQQKIRVYDRVNPTVGTQDNLEFNCTDVQIPADPTYGDACTTAHLDRFHYRVNSTECDESYVLYRNFRVSDDCGNTVWLNYTITVTDVEAPTFTIPPNRRDRCEPVREDATNLDDNCDENIAFTADSPKEENSTVCLNEYNISRTWTATDDCGKTTTKTQLIEVYNDVHPEFDGTLPPTELHEQCDAPAAPKLTAKDGCGHVIPVEEIFTNTTQGCRHRYIANRTYVATDDCGLATVFTQLVYVNDTTKPELVGVPANTTAKCGPEKPASVCAKDSCDGVTINYTQEIIPNPTAPCANRYTVVRTWTATDDCGNTHSESQYIEVNDDVDPVFDSQPPADDYATCTHVAPQKPTATDNCKTVEVTDHSYRVNGSCEQNYEWHVAFLATDACGNTAWWNYTIFVSDIHAPVIDRWDGDNSDQNFTCGNEPARPTPIISDNCNTGHVEDLPDERVNGTCEDLYTVVRRWRIYDDCENSYVVNQTITGVHPDAPHFTQFPVDENVESCTGTPSPVDPPAFDMCGRPLDVTPNTQNTTDDQKCIYNFDEFRTWTASKCGLSTTINQTIHWRDNTKPVFDEPSDQTLNKQCTYPDPATPSANDTCDPNPTVQGPTVVESDRTCKYRFTNTYTWNATDACGNVQYADQQIKYTWNNAAPSIDKPILKPSYKCVPPTRPEVNATDFCGVPLYVEPSEKRVNHSCPEFEYTLTWRWNTTDDCGETAEWEQTFEITNPDNPTLHGVPPHTTAECGFIPKPAHVTGTAGCGGPVNVTSYDDIIEGASCCNYTIVRTYSGVDICGRVTNETQIITVVDTIPPRLHGVPSDRSEPCPWTPDQVNVTGEEPPLAVGYCANADYTVDSCGNPATATAFVVGGNTLSVAGTVFAEYLNGQAFFDIKVTDGSAFGVGELEFGGLKYLNEFNPVYSPPAELDPSCYGNGANQVSPSQWNYYTQAVGWLYFNNVNYTLVEDSTTPSQVGTGANGLSKEYGASLYLKSGSDSVLIRLDFSGNGFDGCTIDETDWPELKCGEPILVNVTNTTIPGSCDQNYKFVRTWCAYDKVGNHICANQTVTVYDSADPVISGLPDSAIDANCSGPIPPPVVPTVTDCDPNVEWHNTTRKIESGVCEGKYTLQYWYNATDDCGNKASAYYEVHVNDNEDPTITGVPDKTVQLQCNDSLAPAIATASDNCGINTTAYPVVSNDDADEAGEQACDQSFKRTYTYTAIDDCGRQTQAHYTISVRDDIKPEVVNVPGNATLECKDAFPGHSAQAKDVCDLTPDLNVSISWYNTSCAGKYQAQRTFQAKDECGNLSPMYYQWITWQDTKKPYFTGGLPTKNETVQCGQTLPIPTPTAADDCEGPITPTLKNWTTGATCKDRVFWYEWTIEDCSGNKDSFVWTVSVVDTVNPTITPAGSDVNAVGCTIPLPPAVCATDNCPGVTLDYEETKYCTDANYPCTGDKSCARYRLFREWVATDSCGNKNNTSYNVFVNDTTAPTCTWTAPPATIPCNASLTVDQPVCSDDCSGYKIEDFSTNSDSSCITNGVRNIAFKVSDYCGNFKWFNSTVTFVDTIGPVITGDFSDVNVTCPNAVPPYTPSVSDQCDGSVQLGTPTEVITPNAACAPLVTVTRTYWAKDKCGNWAQNKTKTWHVIDTTAPTFDQPMPQNVTVNCSEIPNVPEGFTATDSCLGKVPVLYGDYQIPGSCPNNYQIVRLWNASDCAGNVVKHVQVITVVDQINPVITFTPPLADREETCKGDFSVPSACASDNCDGVNVTYSNKKDQPVAGCDKYTITRTWVATDACGNKSPEYKYTITVNDTVAPECPTVSDDSTTCDLPNAKDPSAPTCTDDCSTVKYSAYNDSKAGDCLDNYDKLFSFLAYDGCGNPTWRNITIHVTDTSAPTFTNPPADETINCTEAANYPVPDVNATDNCDTTVKPVFVPVSNGFEQGKCANYTIVRRWTLKDRCGNPAADHTQTITVQDVVAPSFIGPLPTNLTLRCNDTREQPELSAEDNCGTAGVQKYSREVSRDCDGNYTVEWKWVATDLCGLTTEHIVYVTYYDNVKPTMTDVEPEINATCGQVPKPPQVCCNDECGGLSMNFHVTRVNGSCDSRYTLHRTWTCTDDCGNQETREQTVKVGDDTPPEFVEPLPNKTVTYECTIEGPPNVTAIDDCTGLTIANLTTEVHQGGCDANYTVIRTYTAYDQCGVAQQYNQTVEVRDTQPPTTCGGFECRLKYSYGQFLKIPEITVPNAYFCANDSCSSVNITLISCVSNQDEVLNATTTLPGFTNQCDYKPDQDALYISGLIDTTDALGRMYVITALIQDQCGHSVTTTREVFIPLDAGSFVKRNLSELLSDECTSIPIDCPDSCPCQTVDHYCADTNAVDLGTLKDPVVTTDGEFTTFKWELVTTADRPTRIAIGLDLTKIQFISASPDANVRIGEVDGSLLTGVFWLSTHVTSDIYYSITVKGAVTAGELVPYQMGGLQSRQDDVPSACNPYNSVKGIASVDVTPDAIYDGVVQIVGAFGGEARNLSVPLKDVIVNLINNNTREVLASVMTDEFGAYSFPGWAANPEHHVILSSTDGFLRPGRSSNIFLIPQTTNAFLDDKWGVSQPAGDNVNFGLLLKPNAQPVYNRPASSVGFEGNSYLSPFWRYQYILPLSPGLNFNKKAEFPQDLLNYWSGAADLLAPCADAGFFEAPGSLKHELRAAALNLVSGRGPFDPYREAAAWFVAYADLACGFSSSSADATIALNLVNLVNQADDLD